MGGFSVYAAMGEGFKSAIKTLEARIEYIAGEMQDQAAQDAVNTQKTSIARKNLDQAFDAVQVSNPNVIKDLTNMTGSDYRAQGYSDLGDKFDAWQAAVSTEKASTGGESTTILSTDMQRFIQEWSFLLTNATNAMKTYGDGLMSLARNL